MQQHDVQLDTVTPQRGPHHRELDGFVGRWKINGEISPTGPGQPTRRVSGIETYEWLPGGYFLVHRWERKLGSRREPLSGIGWIAFDPKSDGYVAHLAASSGYQRLYRVQVEKDQLIFSGEAERATIIVNDDHTEIIIKWEQRASEGSWKALCHLEGVKLNS